MHGKDGFLLAVLASQCVKTNTRILKGNFHGKTILKNAVLIGTNHHP